MQEKLDLSDFLIVFLSIIYGYIVTTFLHGWKEIIHTTNKTKYWLHLGWTIFTFIFAVQAWWGLWPDRVLLSSNFLYFFSSLIVPIQLYFLSIFLLPSHDSVTEANLTDYFYNKNKIIFIFFGTLLVTMLINGKIYKNEMVITINDIFRITGIVIAFSLAFSKNQKWHIFGFAFSNILLFAYIACVPCMALN